MCRVPAFAAPAAVGRGPALRKVAVRPRNVCTTTMIMGRARGMWMTVKRALTGPVKLYAVERPAGDVQVGEHPALEKAFWDKAAGYPEAERHDTAPRARPAPRATPSVEKYGLKNFATPPKPKPVEPETNPFLEYKKTCEEYSAELAPEEAADAEKPGIRELLRGSRSVVRAVWDEAVEEASTCIDATCGRGSDVVNLAQRAGRGGIVHGLDIQQVALDEAQKRVAEARHVNFADVILSRKSHEQFKGLRMVDEGSVSAIVYNLGYYPGYGADRSIITQTESTWQSLHSAQPLIKSGGVITVTAYVGHEGGREELAAVETWAGLLPIKEWCVTRLSYPNRTHAPVVFLCERL